MSKSEKQRRKCGAMKQPISAYRTWLPTPSVRRDFTMRYNLVILAAALLVSACADSGGHPPLVDLKAVTEPKPLPIGDIAADPVADAHYNASLEAWGDRLRSAGVRLCNFFECDK